uniref:DUF4283 domain-containing protein n=1 Tax=Cannabis sativa TaxID=3483 RepID=A0A803QFZ8_CANSA
MLRDFVRMLAFYSSIEANERCSVNISHGNITNPPILRSGNVKRSLENSFSHSNSSSKVKITVDDTHEEIEFWKSSIVCYVLGANPPLSILEGFSRRMWKDKDERVGMVSYGFFLIRFNSIEDRDKVLKWGYIFFNKRPVVIKSWDPEINFKKKDIRVVPIRVHLDDLELKYWGEKSLIKIIGQVGKPIMVDEATKKRDKLGFPRVLIEVSLQKEYPDLIEFEDEKGTLWRDSRELAVKDSWLVLRNFNDILNKDERIGNRVRFKVSSNFKDCVETCQLEDVKFTCNFFTWSNKQGEDRIYSKIDRVLANQCWFDNFPTAEVHFQNEEAVAEVWSQQVNGTNMYQFVSKLRNLKQVFKALNQQHFADIPMAAMKAKDFLDCCQDNLRKDPLNFDMQQQELTPRIAYAAALDNYHFFL